MITNLLGKIIVWVLPWVVQWFDDFVEALNEPEKEREPDNDEGWAVYTPKRPVNESTSLRSGDTSNRVDASELDEPWPPFEVSRVTRVTRESESDKVRSKLLGSKIITECLLLCYCLSMSFGATTLPPGQAVGILGDRNQFGPLIREIGRGPSVNLIVNSERFMTLDRKESYFSCTQHDGKSYDFDGRMIVNTGSVSNPMLSSESVGHLIPLRQRRPSAPYRLAKKIVRAFTNLLFSEGRSPIIQVNGDEATRDFIQCIVNEGKLMHKMVRARDLGGATGSVGLSWCFHNGKPRFNVHNAKYIFVNKWIDRDELIPEHVIEMYKYSRDEYDHISKRVIKCWYWYRRDWLPDFDLLYKEIPVDHQSKSEPQWEIDEDRSFAHGDGVCHFEYIQNLPTDEVDGEADYDGLYDNFDTLDVLSSVISRGGIANLDPTLVLNVDVDVVQHRGIKKGSDNALLLNQNEQASYLELSGQSITIGMNLVEFEKNKILEIAECILPDPDTLAAQGTSSIALKVIYAAMTAKCDILRTQYENGLTRMLTNMYNVAKKRWKQTIITLDEETGLPVEGEEVLVLPPRVEKIPKHDAMGMPIEGQEETVMVEREPGLGGTIELQWGPYFKSTPADIQSALTTLQLASGGKPVLSHKTAVYQTAKAIELNPDEEYAQLMKERQEQAESMMGMFPGDAAGKVNQPNDLPDEAEPIDVEIVENELPENVIDGDEPDNLVKDAPGPPGEL